MKKKTIEEVLNEHTKELMSVKGVEGTAIGTCRGKPCIKVYVIRKTNELSEKIPTILEGYDVKIEETGKFHSMPENNE